LYLADLWLKECSKYIGKVPITLDIPWGNYFLGQSAPNAACASVWTYHDEPLCNLMMALSLQWFNEVFGFIGHYAKTAFHRFCIHLNITSDFSHIIHKCWYFCLFFLLLTLNLRHDITCIFIIIWPRSHILSCVVMANGEYKYVEKVHVLRQPKFW